MESYGCLQNSSNLITQDGIHEQSLGPAIWPHVREARQRDRQQGDGARCFGSPAAIGAAAAPRKAPRAST